jgi:hypothetical protein
MEFVFVRSQPRIAVAEARSQFGNPEEREERKGSLYQRTDNDIEKTQGVP